MQEKTGRGGGIPPKTDGKIHTHTHRYNAFFALYPLGISCECLLVYASLGLARAWAPLYAWFLVAALAVYVPGMFVFPYLCFLA